MKKVLKNVLCFTLSAAMLVSMAACGNKGDKETTKAPVDTAAKFDGVKAADLTGLDYDATSEKIYQTILGNFYSTYMNAQEKATSISERYALMAIAEAKLMESAVMLPTTNRGGNFAISRVAFRTGDFTLWGSDQDRYHSVIVATEFIKPADRNALKALWNETKGTGTYLTKVKEYLTKNGYTLKDTYTTTYTSDPKTWDALATSRAADTDAIINTYDGLYEYDSEGIQQPALATSYTVSADGLKYTFKIREGVKWVDSQGREIGEVTADDFVAGMQHMFDAMGGLEYLVQDLIVGANDYIKAVDTDFTKVGVKAVDKYTLEYTLVEPCSYFMTMLGYSIFAPMNRQYYQSQGGKFGTAYVSDAADYNYGKTPDNIAYCGPYLVTNATSENKIVFSENPTYYNKSVVNVKTITWLFNDGSDPTKAYNDALAGTIDGAGLTTNTLPIARQDGNFDKYAYTSDTDATSYMGFININRKAYATVADETAAKSEKTEAQKTAAQQALLNNHFRLALCQALDRAVFNEQKVGADLKVNNLTNSYTPWNFVSLAEDVTVSINGKSTTFKAGTFYGQIMQAQIDADGYSLKVYDATADNGNGSGTGYDGWYNPTAAMKELETAIAQLKEVGVEVTKENPIVIDYPYPSNNTTYTNCAQAYKKSVEASLGGYVKVNLVACANASEWYNCGYYTEVGYEANYDYYDLSGWAPDFGDPKTYLDTFLPDYAGYMVKCIGIY